MERMRNEARTRNARQIPAGVSRNDAKQTPPRKTKQRQRGEIWAQASSSSAGEKIDERTKGELLFSLASLRFSRSLAPSLCSSGGGSSSSSSTVYFWNGTVYVLPQGLLIYRTGGLWDVRKPYKSRRKRMEGWKKTRNINCGGGHASISQPPPFMILAMPECIDLLKLGGPIWPGVSVGLCCEFNAKPVGSMTRGGFNRFGERLLPGSEGGAGDVSTIYSSHVAWHGGRETPAPINIACLGSSENKQESAKDQEIVHAFFNCLAREIGTIHVDGQKQHMRSPNSLAAA
ncbi:uncharacterized protein LOC112341184 [Selaginella moellendorffii]|uniref:uncharacterized protein LOC112341184 n=1 Tax=Selaginella moellendorffii TaxID=88036 RepID=UPI000D1C2B05|nr:uncharacterized protein LOC112341184 [Selaginella moellendorffii]|eukprot:XP_024516671.1 uncharacterized protein LOC112341184 [Selaginella moellendorffii]